MARQKKPGAVIYGAGGHAECLIDIIEREGRWSIVGLIDDARPKGSRLMGYPVLGNGGLMPQLFRSGVGHGFVAIGDNRRRRAGIMLMRRSGIKLISPVHPFSSIGRETTIKEGTCVFHGAVIDPCVRIGRGVIINKRALIGHDSVIGDFVHIAPGVNCGANARIAPGCLIGIGATIIPRITIGEHVVIGAGSVVIRDVPPRTTVVGIPARALEGRRRP